METIRRSSSTIPFGYELNEDNTELLNPVPEQLEELDKMIKMIQMKKLIMFIKRNKLIRFIQMKKLVRQRKNVFQKIIVFFQVFLYRLPQTKSNF